jgi:GMP synthase (glutamine-hydrolysing)
MQPVLILQHLSTDGPGYLGTWLRAQGVPFEVRNTEAGQAYPTTLDGYGALAILGGEMSANDPLPSLRQAEALFLQAVARGVPTVGHCLGGQLMARALGAAVTRSPATEIGWHTLQVHEGVQAQAWLGAAGPRVCFEWHQDSFALPPGAEWVASSPGCPHQAFALGPHLAMQWHVEVDADKVAVWSQEASVQFAEADAPSATVHSGPRMRADVARFLAGQQRLADQVYTRWLQGAAPGFRMAPV